VHRSSLSNLQTFKPSNLQTFKGDKNMENKTNGTEERTEERKTIEEIASAASEELGFAVQVIANHDLFAILRMDDFDRVLPTKFIRTMDELQDIVFTLSEKDSTKDQETLAKHLVDGLWSHARSIEYSKKTKEDKLIAARQKKLAEDRIKYESLIKDSPKLLLSENFETLLNLQRTYGVIDHGTYQLLINQHLTMARLVSEAMEAARQKVLTENPAPSPSKDAAA